MSNLVLGLDLGPNSIGWALLEESNGQILDTGARVFPEGVDRDQQGGEKSKSQSRRVARGMRRQIARRARRRHRLRNALTAAGLLPHDNGEFERLLAKNPYDLRRRALDEKLQLHEIGRVLLHLNQRRGFLSNRKTDKARENDTKGMLAEISELAAAIDESGSRTLGEYLANLGNGRDNKTAAPTETLRKRHTRRDMYQHEFDAIWRAQQKHHPNLLTDRLKYGSEGKQDYPTKPPKPLGKRTDAVSKFGIYGLIFFQRKMYWPKSVVGRCELERKHKRCPRADRAAQRFRIVQEVNNLRFTNRATRQDRPLSPEERTKLVDVLLTTKEQTFDSIRKKLDLPDTARFNFERAERAKLKGHETDAALRSRNVLGEKRWNALPEAIKDAVVAILIEEEREDVALNRLTEHCDLTREEAERALAAKLPDGHMNFSRLAIDNLLPHLEQGLMLMADDASNSAIHAAGYLRPDERAVGQRDYLPEAPELANPIVRQALYEVRKVVNCVLREHVHGTGHKLDRIHIELAREAKKSFDQRAEIRMDNAKRRRARDSAAEEIEKYGARATRATVNRYLLWKEQDKICAYSGRPISTAQLFGGEVDVDHILPRWRSLDDSMANKVVCFRDVNDAKGDRTPYEWLAESDPEAYDKVLRLADKLPANKRSKFYRRDVELTDFVERQLRDTAYISRCVTQYLKCLGAAIVCPRGHMTAELRHWWGLNTILDPAGGGAKNRADHRHHAIDAIAIALTNRKRLHALANARGKQMPLPWDSFREDVERVVGATNVSHRNQRRLSGALHEATFYGQTEKPPQRPAGGDERPRPWAKDWVEEPHTYVRRKAVAELTNTKHLAKVRDETIRQILREHLRQRGVDPDTPGKIPGDAFKGDNTPRMPSGVPIKEVRMLEESETFCPVSERRDYQYVKPGNNHHIAYRTTGQGDAERWTAEVVTMWEAARRARLGEPVVDCTDGEKGRFVMSLSKGEMFEIDDDQGEVRLCVVRKFDQRSKRVDYKLHTDARQAGDINKDNLYLTPENLRRRNAAKVTVDPLGRVRRASD